MFLMGLLFILSILSCVFCCKLREGSWLLVTSRWMVLFNLRRSIYFNWLFWICKVVSWSLMGFKSSEESKLSFRHSSFSWGLIERTSSASLLLESWSVLREGVEGGKVICVSRLSFRVSVLSLGLEGMVVLISLLLLMLRYSKWGKAGGKNIYVSWLRQRSRVVN